MKASLWVITALVASLATFHTWSPSLFGKSAVVASINGKTVALKVSGMFCSACAVGIEKSLKKVPGVQGASVDFDKEEAVVLIEPGQADKEALFGAVKAAGPYTAQVKEDGP